MRQLLMSLFSLLAASCAAIAAPERASEPAAAALPVSDVVQQAATPPDAGFALLELFTSEGCSSTPPAEAAVNRLLATNQPILALAFHVPYWDYLGWKDLYASDPNTARQQAYARALGHSNVYTPQVVLDGAGDLPWDDDRATQQAIAAAIAQPRPARVTLVRDGDADVRYTVTGAPVGARLQLALVERGLRIPVTRGENAGHTLAHGPVVRDFQALAPGTGVASLHVPADVERAHAAVVAFVQDPVSMRLSGAARIPLDRGQ